MCIYVYIYIYIYILSLRGLRAAAAGSRGLARVSERRPFAEKQKSIAWYSIV